MKLPKMAVGERPQKSLSILIYGLNYAPEMLGVGRYTGEIGQYLSGNGHKMRVVTAPPHYAGWAVKPPYFARRYASEVLGGVSIVRCPIFLRTKMHGIWRLLAPLSFALSSAPVVVWTILRRRPDILFCVEPTLFAAPAALFAAKWLGALTILHVQDLEVDAAFAVGHLKGNLAQKIAGFFERSVLRSFDQVISISKKMEERLISKGVQPDRISVIRNWVDLDRIYPLAGPNPFRAELGLSDKTFVVLYSGSIGLKHALDLVLDVAAKFANDKNFAFVIAGEGPEKPRLMDRYGHLANVYFLPLQPENKLCELLNFADLHVLPQHRGMADLVLPSKLGGLLASGKPILVTADADTELFDLLQETAIIVPAGDTEAMAKEILRLAKGQSSVGFADCRKLAELFSNESCLRQMHCQLAAAHGRKAQPRHIMNTRGGISLS